MEVYQILFWDSFNALFVFSFGFETAWHSAVMFGGYNVPVITAICLAGSVLGAMATWGIGYVISLMRKKVIELDEELYERLSTNFSRFGVFVFLCQFAVLMKPLYLFAGMFQASFRKVLLLTVAGRLIYYLFYLVFSPTIIF